MGFKFYKLNLIYRACYTSFSGTIPRSSSPVSGIQLLNFHLQNSSAFFENPTYKIPRRWHLGHSHHDDEQLQSRGSGKGGENIFKLGLGADIGLAAGKTVTGYLTGSTAIIADAAHSISDVVLSGVALWSFKAAKAPKDKEHPYGHGKFESLGALGISCMLLASAGGIAWHALDLLLGLLSASPEVINQSLSHEHVHNHSSGGHDHGIDMNHPVLGLSMIIISISVKEGLYWITKQAGEKRGSGLMKANAWHHRADAISSVVALVGVGGAIVGVKFLDPLAGLVVSGMILKAGLETGYQSILELVDAAIPADYLDPIKTTIKQVEGVKGCHRLRGRRAGSSLYLDVHIEVDPFLSVSAAHEVGENVRRQIQDSHPEVSEVFIHIDPSISELPPSMADLQGTLMNTTNQNRNNGLAEDKAIEEIVCNVISSKFPEMEVKHITHHLLRGKILLQIEVSMPNHDIFIRDAMELAEKAEAEIVKVDSNIVHVGIQLCLGSPDGTFCSDQIKCH